MTVSEHWDRPETEGDLRPFGERKDHGWVQPRQTSCRLKAWRPYAHTGVMRRGDDDDDDDDDDVC